MSWWPLLQFTEVLECSSPGMTETRMTVTEMATHTGESGGTRAGLMIETETGKVWVGGRRYET